MLIASAVLAVAAPGTVTKVSGGSFSVHYDVHAVSKHGMANAYSGSSREKTFTVTPKTTYSVNGGKGSFADIQKGVHVNVKASSGVASHVDVVP